MAGLESASPITLESLRWLEDAIVVGTGKQSGFNPTYDFFVIGRER